MSLKLITLSILVPIVMIAAGPRPPLERLPNIPASYVPPPPPSQPLSSTQQLQIHSNRLALVNARRRQHRAVMQLAAEIGAPTGTTCEAVMARAEAFESVNDAVDNDIPLAAGTSAAAAVIGALAGYLAARKKTTAES